MQRKIIILLAAKILPFTGADTVFGGFDLSLASHENSFSSHQNKSFSSTGNDTNIHKIYTELQLIVEDLKTFTLGDSIDFAGFEKSEKIIHGRCSKLQESTFSNIIPSSWKNELAYALIFYQSMKEASQKRSLARKCDYHGDDLVEGLTILCVRILALYKMKNEPVCPEFPMKMARLEHRYEALQERIKCDSKMLSDTKFEVKILKDDVEEAFNITKRSGSYIKPAGLPTFCFLT